MMVMICKHTVEKSYTFFSTNTKLPSFRSLPVKTVPPKADLGLVMFMMYDYNLLFQTIVGDFASGKTLCKLSWFRTGLEKVGE